LRDLYDSAEQAREGGNRELVEWLRKQPDVKREVLLRELRSLAAGYNMTSTFKALGGTDPNRPGEGPAPWQAQNVSPTGRDGAGAKPGTLDQLIEEVRALREEIRHLREQVEKLRG